MRRREFLHMAALGAASQVLSGGALKVGTDEMERQRREMLSRRRRVIFNNDGCDALYFPKDKQVTPENFLARRTTPLMGSHVDSVFFCPTSSGFGNFTYRTEVGHVLVKDMGFKENMRNATGPLIELGTDPLEVVTDFCRAHGIEVFFSMRMNDTHDAAHSPDNPYPLFPPLKKEHPEYLMGTRDDQPEHGKWSAVDYTLPEIRELAYKFFEEVCQNYDVDGIEMDFFRHPHYFKRVSMGGTAAEEERDMMTGLIRRVRGMTEREGRRRGRPFLMAVRVPDSVEYCRDLGLDIERWLHEGLIDILVGSGYFKLNRWNYLVEVGHRHGARVYPCLSESRIRNDVDPFGRNSRESYRARASRAWASGADGVYMFNFFDADSPLLREIGDAEVLGGLDKTYFVTTRNDGGYSNPSYWVRGGNHHMNVPLLSPRNPLKVSAGETEVLEIVIGDDVADARRQGLEPRVACYLRRSGQEGDLSVRLNGRELQHGNREGEWLCLPVDARHVRPGGNRFRFSAGQDATISDLVVQVEIPG